MALPSSASSTPTVRPTSHLLEATVLPTQSVVNMRGYRQTEAKKSSSLSDWLEFL